MGMQHKSWYNAEKRIGSEVTMRPFINIIIGGFLVAGGLSGKFALLGTDSPVALAAVGLIPIGIGVYQLINQRRRERGD